MDHYGIWCVFHQMTTSDFHQGEGSRQSFAVLLEKRWPVSQQFTGENGVAKCGKQFCLVADNGFLDFAKVNFVFINLKIYKPEHWIVNNLSLLSVRSLQRNIAEIPKWPFLLLRNDGSCLLFSSFFCTSWGLIICI